MELIKTIGKLLRGVAVFLLIVFFILAALWPSIDCNWYMPGPCPEGWDPINECIKGHDCPD
jgi:hypothetical protein